MWTKVGLPNTYSIEPNFKTHQHVYHQVKTPTVGSNQIQHQLGISYSASHSLNSHTTNVLLCCTGKKYICEDCGKVFIQLHNLL